MIYLYRVDTAKISAKSLQELKPEVAYQVLTHMNYFFGSASICFVLAENMTKALEIALELHLLHR